MFTGYRFAAAFSWRLCRLFFLVSLGNMLTAFLDKIETIHPLSSELRNELQEHTQTLEVKRGDIILKDGQCSNHVTLVLSGLIRSYYLKDGEDISSRFTTESEIVLSVNNFYSRRRGYEYLEPYENSIIAQTTFEKQEELLKNYLEYNYIVRLFTQKYYAASEEHLFQLRKQTAENKWQYFLDSYPHLVQRVKVKDIASFLGVRQETLSRMRAGK